MSDLEVIDDYGCRLDASQRELANALRRIYELERHLETEVEIVHDIACEAESAQAGESAALEQLSRVSDISISLSGKLASKTHEHELAEAELVRIKKWMTDHGLVVPQFEAAE